MLHRGETQVGRCKFLLLQLHESTHLATSVTMSQFKHAIVQRVEAGQRNELEFVAHGPKFALEFRDRGVVQVFLPVERRRAVISQHLAGKLPMDGFSNFAGIVPIGDRKSTRLNSSHYCANRMTYST